MSIAKRSVAKVISVFLVLILLIGIIPLTEPVKVRAATQNQLNIAARGDYMYNLTWECQTTITGWRNNYTFYAGQSYRIPYAWPVTAGKWVGYGISIEDFLAATQDATSDFYTKQSYYSGNSGSYAPYYGSDCSTFVSWCWDLPVRRTTSSITTYTGVSLISSVTTSNVNSYLQLGDALNYAGSHIVLVTDITYDSSGSISTIEITEQTPPQLKRTTHTVSSLVSTYGSSYSIYRYSGTVSAAPVDVSVDPDSYTVPTADLAIGASGSEVSWVQSVLLKMGYSIEVDGAFGSATQSAVSLLQTHYGLPVTGIVDSATRALLINWWNDKTGVYQTTTSVNMRSGAGTSYDVITTLASGTSVSVVGFNDALTWANIIYNGTEGWVSTAYLSFVRRFTYTMNYNTNISTAMSSHAVVPYINLTIPSPPTHPDGATFSGWQLLRVSDWVWYTGSSWSQSQGDSKMYSPGEVISFGDSLFNEKFGDDIFYFCAVWDSTTPPELPYVTPNEVSPSLYGWAWPQSEAYGIFTNYGGNGQDIELCVDLCLLPSDEESVAVFYTDVTTKSMIITPSAVTVGSTTVAYDWGEVSLDNWHDVKFKVIGGMGYIYIDGELIASSTGITANESYQLLFSYTGEMAIDNPMLYSSDGTVYFSSDFDNESEAKALFGDSLGEWTLLYPDTSDFTLSLSPSSVQINGTGTASITATPSAGNNHSYSWSSSNSLLNSYISSSDNKCNISIPNDIGTDFTATITCTATSDGGVSSSSTIVFTYFTYPSPTISSISPEVASVTDTGSATFTANASGDGLSYTWTCSNSALTPYLSGINSKTLTINITEKLSEAFSATLICTVTNTYGKATVSSPVSFSYELSPEPQFSMGDANMDGQITAADLNLVKRYSAGIISVADGSELFTIVDINGDGIISSKDVNALMRLLIQS